MTLMLKGIVKSRITFRLIKQEIGEKHNCIGKKFLRMNSMIGVKPLENNWYGIIKKEEMKSKA
jgi:hypothetical protein